MSTEWAGTPEGIRRWLGRKVGRQISDPLWKLLMDPEQRSAKLIQSIIERTERLGTIQDSEGRALESKDREGDLEDLLSYYKLVVKAENVLATNDASGSDLLASFNKRASERRELSGNQGQRKQDVEVSKWIVPLSEEENERSYVVSNAILRRADKDPEIGELINRFRAKFGISDEQVADEQSAREMWQLLQTEEGRQQYGDDPFAIAWIEVAQLVAHRFDWELEDAACWAVNWGVAGFRDPVRVGTLVVPWASGDNARIQLSVEPWVSPETVGAVYTKIRKMIMTETWERHHAIPLGKLRLFDFVDRRVNDAGDPLPGETWQDIHRQWKEFVAESPDDLPTYAHPRTLARAYRRVRDELLRKRFSILPPEARDPGRPNTVRWFGDQRRELVSS